jgi:hypothetical protein
MCRTVADEKAQIKKINEENQKISKFTVAALRVLCRHSTLEKDFEDPITN